MNRSQSAIYDDLRQQAERQRLAGKTIWFSFDARSYIIAIVLLIAICAGPLLI